MLDALVVGAGPTGLVMAAELLRHGLRCRLVDQLPGASPLSRALAVQARTLEVFDDLGIVEQALARGRRVDTLNVVAPGGHRRGRLSVEAFSTLETRYNFLFILPQDETEALLTGLVTSLGGAVEWGVAFEGYREEAGSVRATLRRADGGEEEVDARWLIGCDGARSRVRKAAGLPFEGETYDDACVLADVQVEWPLPAGELSIVPSLHGVVIGFPMPGPGRFRVIAFTPRPEDWDDTAPLSLEEMQATVARLVGAPVRLREPRWLTRYRLHRRGVPHYRQGRVLLAGDAAHIHSPAGGQGMNTGIQDAYNLGWKLALVCQERVPEALLDTYNAERHPVGEFLLERTDRLFGWMTRGGLLGGLLRARLLPRLAATVLSRPSVQRRAVRFASELDIAYPDSPLSRESIWGDDPGGGAFAQGPVPGERVPDAPVQGRGVTRLHDVLRGPHHTLLLFAGLLPPEVPLRELEALAAHLEEAYGVLLRARVVAAGEEGSGPAVLKDAGGVLHRRFGAVAACLYLVRPDGYLGFRARPIDRQRLMAELAARLGPPLAVQGGAQVGGA